jgi:hypothetical protein
MEHINTCLEEFIVNEEEDEDVEEAIEEQIEEEGTLRDE